VQVADVFSGFPAPGLQSSASRWSGQGGAVELKLLGPTEVVIDGVRPALGGPRQRAVLADLALHAGRPVVTAQLVDDVWGESPPASATHTLEAYVSRLRQVLQVPGTPPVLVKRGSGYLLDVDESDVDALRFGALAAQGRAALERDDVSTAEGLLSSALALWRGPALADIRDAAFAVSAAQWLESDRLGLIETLVDVHLRLGHHHEAISDLEEAIRAEPFRERFHAQLMTALYRSGRQADALASFQRARNLLGELGLEPGRELRDLERAILLQAPGLEAVTLARRQPPAGATAALDGPPGDAPAYPSTVSVGRRRRFWARGHSRRWTAGVCLLALVVAGLVAFGSSKLGGSARPAPVAVAAVGVSELTAAHDRIARSLALPGEPGSAVFGDGSVWVTSPEADALYRIDPATGSIDDTIPVGAGAGALVIAGSDVWVVNTLDGTLSRVDVATDKVVQTVAVGPEPTEIAVGDGSLWVADASASTLTAIDAATGQVRHTVPLSVPPYGVAFGAGSVWLSNQGDDSITRLSPKGGPAVRLPVGAGPTAVVFGLGSLWVANGLDSTVSRINPATDAVAATIPVGDGPDALATVGDSVWVADRLSSTLTRIDAGTDGPTKSIPIGPSPVAVCATGSGIWVATQAAVGRQTGGTLRVVQSTPLPSIDPALSYEWAAPQFFEGTYDSLVTYQQTGGSAGLQLVPNLALTMPTVSDGGTVYTFTLRPRLRYSDGLLVRPEDFRYAIERVMQLDASAASFLTGIVGAASCRSDEPCDLDRGITVSDRADTVTFHLTAPDAYFLYKLAFRFTAPVPAAVPAHDVGTDPVPSTGPYMIGRYLPGREVDFVRNPYFKEWSAAAEPTGSPNNIVWTFKASVPAEVAAIEAGRDDWTPDSLPDVAGLDAQYPTQMHINPLLGMTYASFNTRAAPFNQEVVRQAFSLAANRGTLVDRLGGPDVATPTCQILPPGIPGYRRYCPFTVDPTPSGAWVGPNLAAARKLVAGSGTQGMHVTVLSQQGSEPIGAFMVSVLRQLGYRASMVSAPPSVVVADTNDSRRGVQATDGEWNADYPSASDFFDLFFRCSSFRLADPAATRNGSFFCDPTIDRLMDAADREQATDPTQAAARWAEVDRDVTDAAPWVPLVNPTCVDFLSTRIGNYQYSPASGVLLDQLSIRHG
jgi:YVTN family beta-propeller protein